jgi:hypothetical protein
MAVAAGVIRDARVGAVLAALDVTAERGGAASFNRRHHAQLAKAHMPDVGAAPSFAVAAEDIRHLQLRRGISGDYAGGGFAMFNASRGLFTCRIVLTATRAYREVESICRWPSRSWMTRMSTPRSKRWVAKLCRNVWTVTVLSKPAVSAARRQARCRERTVMGRAGSGPGNRKC